MPDGGPGDLSAILARPTAAFLAEAAWLWAGYRALRAELASRPRRPKRPPRSDFYDRHVAAVVAVQAPGLWFEAGDLTSDPVKAAAFGTALWWASRQDRPVARMWVERGRRIKGVRQWRLHDADDGEGGTLPDPRSPPAKRRKRRHPPR